MPPFWLDLHLIIECLVDFIDLVPFTTTSAQTNTTVISFSFSIKKKKKGYSYNSCNESCIHVREFFFWFHSIFIFIFLLCIQNIEQAARPCRHFLSLYLILGRSDGGKYSTLKKIPVNKLLWKQTKKQLASVLTTTGKELPQQKLAQVLPKKKKTPQNNLYRKLHIYIYRSSDGT